MTETERLMASGPRVTEFDAPFVTELLKTLSALGYAIAPGDAEIMCLAARKVEREIKNACNVPRVPEGLREVARELILAEFLSVKRATGNLDIEALNCEPLIKQITEGDTSVVYATEQAISDEQRFDLLIASLSRGREQFIGYRRLKW